MKNRGGVGKCPITLRVRQLVGEIDGRLSDGEGELLYRLAKNVPSGEAILEIGSWKGKSTVWLAKGTEAGEGNKVYSIHHHSVSENGISRGREDTHPAFLSDLTKAGVQDTVIPLVETSDEAAKHWTKKVGLLWFNASHEYEDIKQALLPWQRYLSPDARIAILGCDQPGPARVVNEYLHDFGNFIFVQSVDTTVVITIDKCIHYWKIDSGVIGLCKYCRRKRNFKRPLRESLGRGVRKGVGMYKSERIADLD